MHKLRVILQFLLLTYVTCDVVSSDKLQIAQSTATTATKLTPTAQSKSKTGKRDSSDQTASYSEKVKDEPFRPIYRAPYAETSASPHFRPTTVRYVAAAAESTPQTYYGKSELTGGIQYATKTPVSSTSNGVPTIGGINYASYRTAPATHAQLAHPSAHSHHGHVPTQDAQHVKIYAFSENDARYSYEREPQQQQQQQQHLEYQRAPHQQQQQRVQYVIAIPLSYVRQLQQQLSQAPAHSAQAAVPHAMLVQTVGPLARDHQGAYRPFHQYAAAASAAAAAANQQPASAHSGAYTTQYIQVPAHALYAAAQNAQQQRPAAYQHFSYEQQQAQPVYQHYQPQQQHHLYAYQQEQQQAQQQPPTQHYQLKQQQPASLQQQQAADSAVVHIGTAKAGGAKLAASTSTAPTSSAQPTPQHYAHQQHQHAAHLHHHHHHQSAPINAVPSSPASLIHHYNPLYVQAQPAAYTEQQALATGALHYVRPILHQAQSQQLQGPTPIPQQQQQQQPHQHHHHHHPLIRLSTPTVLLAPQQQPASHYYPMAPATHHQYYAPPQPAPLAQPRYSYYTPGLSTYDGAHAPIPYFVHPGGVHYGTHLYHPPSPTVAGKGLQMTAASTPLDNQPHHQQQRQTSSASTSESYQPEAAAAAANAITAEAKERSSSDGANVVKYP